LAKRLIFVLDSKGVILYMWISDNPAVESNYKEIEKTIGKSL